MKIFRAVIEYNNGDTCEWEEWQTKTSKWYADKALAEKHITLLGQFRDFLNDEYVNNSAFCCNMPYIEEQEIAEEFVPMKLEYMGKEFKGFEYIPYEGPYSISSQELVLSSFPCPSWYIELSIGDEDFDISFSVYSEDYRYSCRKAAQEDSKFFKYTPEVREELLSIVEEYAKVISPYFKKYREDSEALGNWDEYDFEDSRRYDGWEAQRVSEVQNIEYLLKSTHLTLSESTISSIKREIEDDRRGKHPKYKEALTRLLSYGSWKPEEYPTEEYGDLAIKLKEALSE